MASPTQKPTEGYPTACEQTPAPLQLHVVNTFLHAVDLEDKKKQLSRSRSDSSLLSSSSQTSSGWGSCDYVPFSGAAVEPAYTSGTASNATSSAGHNEERSFIVIEQASSEPAPQDDADSALPSAGSSLHESGNCTRCSFFVRNKCMTGKSCKYCHFPHEPMPQRPCRQKRDRMRKQELEKE